MSSITEDLKSKYLAEIRSWDWDWCHETCRGNVKYEKDVDAHIGSAFLGTIMNMTPSGKVYTPWANSNVEPCPHCEGVGRIINPNYDHKAHEAACEASRRMRLKLLQDYGSISAGRWPKAQQQELENLDRIAVESRVDTTCPHCDGIGSEEACMDELWQEALATVAEEQGGWIDSGEGDGCDIFFCMEFDMGDGDDEEE